MLIQPEVTSFPWVTISRRGWGGQPTVVTKLPGTASHPEKEKDCDLRSFPDQQGFPGVGEASDRGRTPRCNPLSSGFSCGALAREDALWATLAPWAQGRREKGGIRVTASSWMEPLARTGLSSHPHCSASPPALSLPVGKCLLAQGQTQGKH